MAFSMFLRSPACRTAVNQQLMQFASQGSLSQRCVASAMPLTSHLLRDSTSTPILNAVRSLRTTPARLSAEKGHDHAKLWVVEKVAAAALVPLLPIGLLMPNKLVDSLLAILITAHSFWGLEAIAVDYVRAAVVGPFLPKVAIALVWIVSIATLGGLFYVISHDIGICATIKQLWAVKSHSQKA